MDFILSLILDGQGGSSRRYEDVRHRTAEKPGGSSSQIILDGMVDISLDILYILPGITCSFYNSIQYMMRENLELGYISS
jgi:hypothetical protein